MTENTIDESDAVDVIHPDGRESLTRTDVLNAISKLATRNMACGLCGGSLTYSLSLEHGKKCYDCDTKYYVEAEDDSGVPTELVVDGTTTPERRIYRQLLWAISDDAPVDLDRPVDDE